MFDCSEYKGKKVLITGHTGFKGSWLSILLLNAGAKVYGYSLEPPTEPSIFKLCHLEQKMHSVIGDIIDFEFLKKTFSEVEPEVVFHLAAQPIVRESYRKPRETFETNVMGTVNVLECIRQSKSVKSVIIITTDKVYFNDGRKEGYKEGDYLCGYDPYSNSKSCADLLTSCYISSFLNDMHIPVSILRAGNVIGGGDFAIDRLIPDCIRSLETREPVIIRNPKATRPFQHVLEPIYVYAMIGIRQMENPQLAGAYNVGPDLEEVKSVSDILYLFNAVWNGCKKGKAEQFRWEIVPDPLNLHEANLLALDNSKCKETFGWKPVWNSYEAVRKTVEWYVAYKDGVNLYDFMVSQCNAYKNDIK